MVKICHTDSAKLRRQKGPAAMQDDGRFLSEANSAMVAPVELETDG
jgi:hypothetical protein